MLASTALVMLMTSGLGLFYEGMARRVPSMISLCFLALAIVGIQWITVGYTLSFDRATGIFTSVNVVGNVQQFMAQIIGAVSAVVYASAITLIVAKIVNAAVGLRVGHEEYVRLDVSQRTHEDGVSCDKALKM